MLHSAPWDDTGRPVGQGQAALTHYLSKQFLLNTPLMSCNSEGLPEKNRSDIFYQAPSEMGQEILRTSLWLLI